MLVHCKREVAWLLEHVGAVSEAEASPAVTTSVGHQGAGMAQMVEMRGLLSRLQALT